MSVPVSVIVPVKNEEANITACLESVQFADEIFVVDSESSDRTCDLARSLGATVVQFHYDGHWPKKKNWALDNLPFRNEWILIIDGDERITEELAAEIASTLKNPAADGYYLNRKVLFMGRWIRHCGWYPNWNMRLFRHALGRYEYLGQGSDKPVTGDNEVHEHVVLQGRADYLKHDMLHEDFRDLFHWIDRHNRYSSWESTVYAQLREGSTLGTIGAAFFGTPVQRKRFFRKIWVNLPFRPLLKFFIMYILKLGFLDGRAGYYFCRLHSHHEFNIQAKEVELKLRKNSAAFSSHERLASSGRGR